MYKRQYLGNAITGAFNAFQFPAFSAAVTLMIPKEQYGRAAGMLDFAGAASNILAPAFAGALLGPLGLAGVMAVSYTHLAAPPSFGPAARL